MIVDRDELLGGCITELACDYGETRQRGVNFHTSIKAVLSIFTWALSFGMPNFLRAAGDAKFTMAVSMACMLLLRVGLSYFMVYGLGLSLLGVWLAMHIDWLARSACFCVRFAGRKWLDKRVI